MKHFNLLVLLTALAVLPASAQKYPHLGDSPQMGWSTWNKFQGNINEEVIKSIADAMVASGLRDAGYTYINIDDCWHGQRDSNGFITSDVKKFPSGMKVLSDYVHSKGLKLGIYSDAGTETCAGMPGSLGHEYQDALQYSRWGVDYLKYDWCNTTNVNAKCAYQLMGDALRAAGRPIFFSMCEWGNNKPWKWARDIGNSWRTTPDIWCAFDSIHQFPGYQQFGVMQCIHYNDTLRQYAGKGHWNDPDMLEVGNGMTNNEDRAHFSMWCMMAAPLILGNDVRDMSVNVKSILMNKEMIAIDQDSLGVQGLHYSSENGLEYWFKPLVGGDWAFFILNPTKEIKKCNMNWQDYNLTDTQVSALSTDFDKKVYRIRDLWLHHDKGRTIKKNQIERVLTIPAHDIVCYRLILNKS